MAQYSGINAILDSPQKDLRLAVFAATDEVKVVSRGTPPPPQVSGVGESGEFGVWRLPWRKGEVIGFTFTSRFHIKAIDNGQQCGRSAKVC